MITFDYNEKTRKGQLITVDDGLLTLVRNHFSVENKSYKFAPRAKKKRIQERIYVIEKMGRFPLGLFKEIIEYLREIQITEISYTAEFKEQVLCGLEIDELDVDFKYEHRYYQEDVVLRGLKYGRGIILSATGSGKSFITASLVQQFYNARTSQNFKCLIIVPGLSLVRQLTKDFEEYGVKFTHTQWSKDEELKDANVVIVNSELMCSRFDDNPWITDVDLLVVDECHKAKAATKVSKLVTKINTVHKFGLTGTLPDDKYNQWKIKGIFGPVFFEKNSKELRDEGFLTEASIMRLELQYSDTPEYVEITPYIPATEDTDEILAGPKTENYNIELNFIYTHERRNEILKNLVCKLDGNTLILVNHIAHGEILENVLRGIGDVVFIQGSVEVDDRVEVVNRMESGSDVICVAMASIFSTGINIKNLHNIIFASGGKSFIRIVQGIGRGLRLHDSKDKLTIIDMCDQLKYGADHATKRLEIYNKEQLQHTTRQISI